MISQLHIAMGYRWPGCLAFASSCRISSTALASKLWGSHRPAAAAAVGENSFLLSQKQQDHPARVSAVLQPMPCSTAACQAGWHHPAASTTTDILHPLCHVVAA